MIAAVTVLAAIGCSVGPDYHPPAENVPDSWEQRIADDLADDSAALHTWWRTFHDPLLDSLIERSRMGSLTLREAAARIDESRALLRVARGDWFPDVNAGGIAERSRVSEDFPVGGRARTDTIYSTGFDASWEVDFWGRIRRSVESARSGYEASVEDYRDALVLLYADVATTYVDVRSLQERIRLAYRNVETQRKTLRLTEDRNRAGLVGKLDVRQAELNLASTESFIPSLKTQLKQAAHRLAVLLGRPPAALYAELEEQTRIPAATIASSTGLPVDLLRRRPDVRRAERRLASQTARIGVATAELYPQLSLGGFFGFEGTADIFDASSQAWSFGPALRWNLFDGGRVRGRIQVEDARTAQALARYEQTVLFALQDTEDALVAYVQERDRVTHLGHAVEAASRSVDLVDTLYRAGLTDFQNVLDTQRSLFVQQDNLATSVGDAAKNLVRVYKALGGGWAAEDDAPSAIGQLKERLGNDS